VLHLFNTRRVLLGSVVVYRPSISELIRDTSGYAKLLLWDNSNTRT